MVETAMLFMLIILLAIASVWDVTLHRIPNALAVGVAGTGLIAQVLHGSGGAIAWSALAVLAAGAATWPAWARGWIGGGDLKLAAATAAWLGLARVPLYLLASTLAIGVLSLACYALSERQARAEVRRNLAHAAKGVSIAVPISASEGRVRVPAGAGFAIASMVVLAMTGGL